MFGFGKRRYLEANSRFLADLLDVPHARAMEFYRSLSYFEVSYALAKESRTDKTPDFILVAQSNCELIIDFAISDDLLFDSIIERTKMHHTLIKLWAAKIGIELLRRGLYKGNITEREIFEHKLNKMAEIEVENSSGEKVTLAQFAVDPIGNSDVLAQFKKSFLELDK